MDADVCVDDRWSGVGGTTVARRAFAIQGLRPGLVVLEKTD